MTNRIYTYNSDINRWDVDKFPRTSTDNFVSKQNSSLNGLTMYDIICQDVFTNKNYVAVYKTNNVQHINLSSITSLDVNENIIKINTEDEVAFYLYCRNNTESEKIENRIFLILSNELDPGC